MRKVIEFKRCAGSSNDVDTELNELIKQGWEPYGIGECSGGYYEQMMAKYEDDEPQIDDFEGRYRRLLDDLEKFKNGVEINISRATVDGFERLVYIKLEDKFEPKLHFLSQSQVNVLTKILVSINSILDCYQID